MLSHSRWWLLLVLIINAGCDRATHRGTVEPIKPAETDPLGQAASPSEVILPSPVPFNQWRREPIYELYVRHFSPEGNFKGVERKLPELKALGIGIVWLMPVHEIGSIVPANGGQAIDAPWGNPYAVKSYDRINAEYGSDRTLASAEADLKSLVDSAHALGMHVILDWVPNHTAWDHAWVTEHPDWYAHVNGAIKPVAGFPWVAQLDWSNPSLRAAMTEAMSSWVRKFQLDGFRIDFAHSMPLDFFAALRLELEKTRPVFLLAESGDRSFHPTFDMTYDWAVYPRFEGVAKGWSSVSALDDALLNQQLIPFAGLPQTRVMRMTYNHDDNGNFTLQDRYHGGIKTFAVLACTLPGNPNLLDGQEVGMRVFDGTRIRESAPLTHDPAVKMDWSDPEGFRPFYTRLLQLHRANPALHQDGMDDFRKVDTVPASPVYSFIRREGENSVLVVLNLSPVTQTNVVLTPTQNVAPINGTYVELFSRRTEQIQAGDSITLQPWEYRVYVQGPTGWNDNPESP